jgi:hypothetical protein
LIVGAERLCSAAKIFGENWRSVVVNLNLTIPFKFDFWSECMYQKCTH